MGPNRQEALLKEYSEVSSNFRLLSDIRFKLLALLPIAAAATAALSKSSSGIPLPISLFGLAATVGLVTYNYRNDQLYGDLVGRAQEIERYLGIPDGSFSSRSHAWLEFRLLNLNWKINHGTGIGVVYAATIALWIFAALSSILEAFRRVYLTLGLPYFTVEDPENWVNFSAMLLAIGIALIGLKFVKIKKKKREDELRSKAYSAVQIAIDLDIEKLLYEGSFISCCADLARKDENVIKTRLNFLLHLETDSIKHYLLSGSKLISASHLVGYLTDLSSSWVFDCATNRRRSHIVENG